MLRLIRQRGTNLQNILIVCADKELRKDLSKVLATELGFLYVDVDEVLDYELLNHQDVTIAEAKEVLKKLELKSINRVLNFNKCVVTISRDLFLSNDNFKLFSNMTKVFVLITKAHFVARYKSDDKYRLEQELVLFDKVNNLISSKCDMTINKEVKSVQDMCAEILDKLKNN